MKRSPLRRYNSAKTRAGYRRLVAARAEVVGRSGGWCEADTPACPEGRHTGHHAHHVLPRSQGGQHEADNLLFVCSLAHLWIHAHPQESYRSGWLLHRSAS